MAVLSTKYSITHVMALSIPKGVFARDILRPERVYGRKLGPLPAWQCSINGASMSTIPRLIANGLSMVWHLIIPAGKIVLRHKCIRDRAKYLFRAYWRIAYKFRCSGAHPRSKNRVQRNGSSRSPFKQSYPSEGVLCLSLHGRCVLSSH